MSTATKLEYLNETKGLLKDNINLTGAGLTNQTPFRQYATDLKTALLNILNNGIDTLYNNFPKTTGTGTNITLNNTLQAPIKSVINGDTEQESYNGNQLIDFNTLSTASATSNFSNDTLIASCQSGQSYPATYKIITDLLVGNIGKSLNIGYKNLTKSNSNANVIIQIEYKISDGSNQYYWIYQNNTTRSFTIPENLTYARLIINIDNHSSSVENTLTIEEPLLYFNNSTYEPYVGGTASPNPDYPQEIKSVTGLQKVSVEGKNLLDTQYFENGSIDGTTGQNVSAPYNARGNNYISVIPNTTYTISANTILTNLRLSEYTNSKTNIQRDVISNNNKLTITTTANTYYLRWSLNYNNSTEITQEIIDSLDLQLELGSATEYEPYQSQEYEINLGKNLLGVTDGTYSNNGITAIVENGKITLNGTASATSFITIPLLSEISLGIANKTLSLNNSQVISDTSTECRLYTSGQDYNSLNFSTINKSTTFSNDRVYTRLQIRTSSGVTYNDFVFKPQLEQGDTATSYSPYFTPIHLYEGDQIIGIPYNWSIKHIMGEVVLNGSESGYQLNGQTTNYNQFGKYIDGKAFGVNNFKSNIFNVQSPATQVYQIAGRSGNTFVSFNLAPTDCEYSQTGLKNWITQHNIKLVYELAESTTEPITNTELINQLNAFYNAKSYNGQTNISIEGDLPMILDVSAIKGDE